MVESAGEEVDERARVSALLAEILYCREESGRLGLDLVRYLLDMAAAEVGPQHRTHRSPMSRPSPRDADSRR